VTVRVAIDATALADWSSVRGIGSIARTLYDGLARDPRFEVIALAPRGAPIDPAHHRVVNRRLPGRLARPEHDFRLPFELRRTRADLGLGLANVPPWRAPYPWVQAVQDLIPLAFADPAFRAEARRLRRMLPALRRCARIVCPSSASADDVIRLTGIAAQRVEVIPLAVDDRFSPDGPVDADAVPHVLWVSAWGPHKGIKEACEVVTALADAGLPHRLRLVGPFDDWTRPFVEAEVAAAPRPDLVDVVGWVDDLGTAYRSADVLICTSRYEGFGLPPLEAQACGTPVVAFATPAVSEISGPGERLVPDGDGAAAAMQVRTLLEDAVVRADVVAAGLANVKRYTWDRCIASYGELLAEVASER
jgi:glycosyltransferase involved in cell wall biosynthesis